MAILSAGIPSPRKKMRDDATGAYPCATAATSNYPNRFGIVNTHFGIVIIYFGNSTEVFTINRNRRSRSAETSVHVPPESVFTFVRNTHVSPDHSAVRRVRGLQFPKAE
jgi:hypothetical protein